jgi:small ligand-binding sensory domain FIST
METASTTRTVALPPGTWAAAGWGEGSRWEDALEGALAQLLAQRTPPPASRRRAGREDAGAPGPAPQAAPASRRRQPASTPSPDLLFVFASSAFARDYTSLVARAREATGARHLLGCSGSGVIAGTQELEHRPAVALLAVALPGASYLPVRLLEAHVRAAPDPIEEDREKVAAYWHRVMASSIATAGAARRAAPAAPPEVNAWLLFADPFHLDVTALVDGLNAAYPGTPIVGGLASGDQNADRTYLFLDDDVFDQGAVAVAIGGAWSVETLVSQGCTPIGQPWTITGVDGQRIETIALRPAYEMLADTVKALPPHVAMRARNHLFAGLAMDERRHTLSRGDFLIRNIYGADVNTGALVLAARPRLGQTIQFQLRDAQAADEDLRAMLERVPERLAGRAPAAALLCSCTGRGAGLFGAPHHDARTIQEYLGPLPLAGFFCHGEIGPVGGRNFVHGYTACLGLLVPKQAER